MSIRHRCAEGAVVSTPARDHLRPAEAIRLSHDAGRRPPAVTSSSPGSLLKATLPWWRPDHHRRQPAVCGGPGSCGPPDDHRLVPGRRCPAGKRAGRSALGDFDARDAPGSPWTSNTSPPPGSNWAGPGWRPGLQPARRPARPLENSPSPNFPAFTVPTVAWARWAANAPSSTPGRHWSSPSTAWAAARFSRVGPNDPNRNVIRKPSYPP